MEKRDVSFNEKGFNEERNHEVRTGHEQTSRLPASLKCSLASMITSRITLSRQHLSLDTIPKSTSLLRLFASFLFACLVSLLPRFLRKDGLKPTKKAHATTFLDALRGWACILVVSHHWNPLKDEYLFSLPFFSVFNRGPGIVQIFFVTSGYVLAYKPLKLVRTRQAPALLDTAASSIFRRWVRLYTSAAIATLVALVVIQFGWAWEALRKDTLASQLRDWMFEFIHFSNVFGNLDGYYSEESFSNKYLTTMWTIPVQFRGSMIVFLFCLGTCKLSTRSRTRLCCLLITLSYYWSTIYVVLFLGGVFLADLAYVRQPERLGLVLPTALTIDTSDFLKSTTPRSQTRSEKTLYTMTAVLAVFLLSQAEENFEKAGWPWPLLDYIVPSHYRNELFWPSIGALLIVWSLDSCPPLQTPFKSDFSRYLGDISFGIYAMHLPVLWTLSANITDPLRASLLGEATWTYIPLVLVNMTAVIWAADLYTKVDDNVVLFGRWTQEQFFTW